MIFCHHYNHLQPFKDIPGILVITHVNDVKGIKYTWCGELWPIQQSVESLQCHCIPTQFHWSPGGYLCETRILLLVLFRYIGDPDVIWSLWPRLRQASSRTVTRLSCSQCDNPTWSHPALLSPFHARCRSSFWLHNWHSRPVWGGGALWRACNLTAFLHSSTGPMVHPFASCHEGPWFNPQGGT